MAEEKKYVEVTMSGDMVLPPAEGANWFHFTSVGSEVQLLVGTMNLLAIHAAQQPGGKRQLVPDITHRFLLSPNGFAVLKAQIDEITPQVVTAGVSLTPKKA